MADEPNKDAVDATEAEDTGAGSSEADGVDVEEAKSSTEGSSEAGGADVEAQSPAGDQQGSDAEGGGSASPADPTSSADADEEAPAEEAPAADDAAPAKEATAEDVPAEEAPAAAPKPAASAAPAADGEELGFKDRIRLERSRQPHKAGAQKSGEDRARERNEKRAANAVERRRYRAKQKSKRTKGTGTPAAERDAVAAKERLGTVTSAKAAKTITVRIDVSRRHPVYHKIVRRSNTLHAHDEQNEASEGDIVRVVETRPLSRTKRWRLVEIVKRAPVEEIVPS